MHLVSKRKRKPRSICFGTVPKLVSLGIMFFHGSLEACKILTVKRVLFRQLKSFYIVLYCKVSICGV